MKHDDEFGYATKPQSEHDARAHCQPDFSDIASRGQCPPRCELCSADHRREALWGWTVLIIGLATLYVISSGMFR